MDHIGKGDCPARLPAGDLATEGAREQPESRFNVPDDSAADEERLKKVNELTQALADGTYRVPNEEVARKVIEHMRERKG